jgi:hypothetical protein
MRARLFTNILRAGSVARDYVRLAETNRDRTATAIDDTKGREAEKVLESFHDANLPEYELDINISGSDLTQLLDGDLESMGLVPHFFTNAACEAGEGISVGSHVIIPGDDRKFRTVAISRRHGTIHLQDANGSEYLVPWQLARPWRE